MHVLFFVGWTELFSDRAQTLPGARAGEFLSMKFVRSTLFVQHTCITVGTGVAGIHSLCPGDTLKFFEKQRTKTLVRNTDKIDCG